MGLFWSELREAGLAAGLRGAGSRVGIWGELPRASELLGRQWVLSSRTWACSRPHCMQIRASSSPSAFECYKTGAWPPLN